MENHEIDINKEAELLEKEIDLSENDNNGISREEINSYLKKHSILSEEEKEIEKQRILEEFRVLGIDFKSSVRDMTPSSQEDMSIDSIKNVIENDFITTKGPLNQLNKTENITKEEPSPLEGMPVPSPETKNPSESIDFITTKGPLSQLNKTENNIKEEPSPLEGMPVPSPEAEKPSEESIDFITTKGPLNQLNKTENITKEEPSPLEGMPVPPAPLIPLPRENWEEKDEMFDRPSLPSIDNLSEEELNNITKEALKTVFEEQSSPSENQIKETVINTSPEKQTAEEIILSVENNPSEKQEKIEDLRKSELLFEEKPDQENEENLYRAIKEYKKFMEVGEQAMKEITEQVEDVIKVEAELIENPNQKTETNENNGEPEIIDVKPIPLPEKKSINTSRSPEQEKKKKVIRNHIRSKKVEIEEKAENLGKNKKGLFKKLIGIAKNKKAQIVIGAAILGLSIVVPPVGGAAFLTGGAISGFLPVELGISTKVLGGAAGGFLLRKIIEKKNGVESPQKPEPESKPEPEPENKPEPEKTSLDNSKEIKRLPKQEIDPKKKKEGIAKNIKSIQENIDKQPVSVQKMFTEMKDKFESVVNIDGKDFMFANISKGKVIALVKEKDSEQWKTRFFRYSESDHQWKALPGERPTGAYLKGEEEKILHHYSQSAKIDKDVYEEIERLSQKDNYDFEDYIPKGSDVKNGKEGQFEEELEFKEDYLELKDSQWQESQKSYQNIFKAYKSLVIDNSTSWTSNYKMIDFISKNIAEFGDLKKSIDLARKEKEYIDYLKNPNSNNSINKFQALKQSSNPKLKEMAEIYEKTIGTFFENAFKSTNLPENMTPDFKKKPTNSYNKGNVKIEEYTVKNDSGDELVFAMAEDEQGRVYIDDIYDPRIGVTDYGTHKKICQMGHLVFKPEDYTTQTFGIPEKYKKPVLDKEGKSTEYTDINTFWENIPLIAEYKKVVSSRKMFENLSEKDRNVMIKKIRDNDQAIRDEINKNPKGGARLSSLKRSFKHLTKIDWSDSFNVESLNNKE
ncbi:MAG: hypothetical protein MNSN_01340 [Minisyncoccus archaeiphilus]|nr:MAG: hypothetical protein MNSN_01340 [Candidatus Parcubacteria bacterium]